MKLPILKVAVVGHTNTGKTSLLRTLMRDVSFGEVSDRPATTRHVEGAALIVSGEPAIELYDTPGLEDSIALREHLDALPHGGAHRGARRTDWIDQIHSFLEAAEARAGGRFAQEAKALRQLLASDVALYVIDARDRVLGKHRDELEILSRCARPVVPVLNFVASPEAQTALWREHLARANMHAVAEFDTVVVDGQSERRLLEKMRTLLDRHHATLDALIAERQQQRSRLIRVSADVVADMLIDAAAHAVTVPANDRAQAAEALEALKARIRRREQQCVQQLLELHRFRQEDYKPGDLPLTDGQWGADLFSPAAMKQFGVRTGGGAAAGALTGLTLDAMVGGMSLGAATAAGAAIGALLGAGHTHARRVIDNVRGFTQLRCDDATLRLLMTRQIALIVALFRRGHASMDAIKPGHAMSSSSSSYAAEAPSPPARLPATLQQAKLKPSWSRLGDRIDARLLVGPMRRNAQDRLATLIQQQIESSTASASPSARARGTL